MKTRITYPHIILFVLFLMICSFSFAQEPLRVNDIFTKYGKKKGATMVVLSGDAIKKYKLDKYQSITLQPDKNIAAEIQDCLESDKKQAHKIKEVITNGIISSGYYQLPITEKRENRYILFKTTPDGKATLIYMQGSVESAELIECLFINRKQS